MLVELLGKCTLLGGERNYPISLKVHWDDLKVHIVIDEVVEQLDVARDAD